MGKGIPERQTVPTAARAPAKRAAKSGVRKDSRDFEPVRPEESPVPETTWDVLYKTGEVAKECQVTTSTVLTWISKGLLAAVQLPGSRHHRVRASVLRTFRATHGL